MFHLSDRSILSVGGPEAGDFLQGLITQDMARADIAPLFAALLTPQGKILFDFFIVKREDGYLLDVAAAVAPALAKRLKMYRLRAKVDISAADDLAVGWGGAVTGAAYADPRLEAIGARVIAPPGDFAGDGRRAYKERRLALGAPEFSTDFAADTMFLTDVNYDALHGVDYKKGCFVGQEVTSRMKRKGDIRRRVLGLSFDGDAFSDGATVVSGATRLGDVVTAIDGLALALIRMDRLQNLDGGAPEMTVDGRSVHVTIPDYLEAV